MNPLYCPECGKRSFVLINNRKWNCELCDFVLYHNVAGAVAVILRYENEIFLTQRAQNPKINMLDLPGGFIDPNETAEEACTRELKEELDIDIPMENLHYCGSRPNIYPYKGVVYSTIDLFYELSLNEKFTPKLAVNEISKGVWIKIKNIDFSKIAFDSQKHFLQIYQNQISE